MKSVLVVLIWTFIVDCNAIQLNSTSLLEGKLQNVQNCKEKAGGLQFLACLYIDDYECRGTGFVIAEYLVVTSNGAVYRKNRISHVVLSNGRHDVEEHLYEDSKGNVEKSIEWGTRERHLVVLTLKTKAGVEPINFLRTEENEDIDFLRGKQLQLAGFTEDGPATLDLILIDEVVEESPQDTPLYIVDTDTRIVHHYVEFRDNGSPILIDNILVGVLTYPRYVQEHCYENPRGYYMTHSTDHKKFIGKVWSYNHPPESGATLTIEGPSE